MELGKATRIFVTKSLCTVALCYSKCNKPQQASVSTWELVRKAESETTSDQLIQNLHNIQHDQVSKEDMQMASRHMKTSLVIREMKIEAIVRYHFIFTNMVMINKNNTITGGWQKCREIGNVHCQ